MASLQNKENKFLGTTNCEEIFQNHKQILTTVPILQITDADGDLVVFIYARNEGIGGLLMQND